jgi:redox-sensitive bicupin YhaK (pirin superfamily)
MSQPITRISGKTHDIGSLTVRRLLPSIGCRHRGPFVFLDLIGPAHLASGVGVDVRPHPHIGLATVTYLFEGALRHRDSEGSDQIIRPGDVNWMSAGRGIVHSERSPGPERAAGHCLHGLQFWAALPQAQEESEPGFQHVAATELPRWSVEGVKFKLVAGSALGHSSPVRVHGDMFLLVVDLEAGSDFELPARMSERTVLLISGDAQLDDAALAANELAVVVSDEEAIRMHSTEGARLIVFGGAGLDAPRHVWWNFVSSSRERIELAKRTWREQGFGQVPGETEFIPLPES